MNHSNHALVDHKHFPPSISELKNIAALLRFRIIETSHMANVPHLGSCLSCVDILTALYFSILQIDVLNPRWEDRDRFILSKGHAAPALFQVLALRGFFPQTDLAHYGEDGSIFAEHPPAPKELPCIEAATGSLGHGMPIGIGMALSARMLKKNFNVYIVLGDGECNEGTIWEAAMFAPVQQLNNLCVIIDFNKWQATDRSQHVMALDPLADKWRAFGWNTFEINGNNIEDILTVLKNFPANNHKPTAIIAHTIKGKGISFMEDDNNWHYRIPSAADLDKAKIELQI